MNIADDVDECRICFEELGAENATELPCGHANACCRDCCAKIKTCPQCQSPFVFQLRMETLHNRVLLMSCAIQRTVREIKEIIEQEHRDFLRDFRYPIAEIAQFVHHGRVLSDDRKIRSLRDGDKIWVVENLYGD